MRIDWTGTDGGVELLVAVDAPTAEVDRRDELGASFTANVGQMRRFVRSRLWGRVAPDRVDDGVDWCVGEAAMAASKDLAAVALGVIGWPYWRRELFAAVGRFASMDAAGLRRPMRAAMVGEPGGDAMGRVYRVGVALPELLCREAVDDQPFDGIQFVVDSLGGRCSQADIDLLAVMESYPNGSPAEWAAALGTSSQAVRMRMSRMRRRLADAGCA